MVAAVAALAVAGAWADAFDPNAATTLKMKVDDNGAFNSFTNFNNWTAQKIAPQLMDETHSAPPNPEAATYDYYVTGHTLRTFKAPPNPRPAVVVFGGKSLRFGSSGIFQSGGDYKMFPLSVSDLHFGSGSAFYLNCDFGLTNSTITVDAENADYPWKILNTNNGKSGYALSLYDCKLIGSANARMRVMPNATSSGPTILYYRGDGSGYLGQIELSARGVQDYSATLKLGKNTDLGNATVNVGLNGVLTRDSGNATVGTVNLTSDSGVIEFVNGGQLRVKNFFMSNGGVTYNSGNCFVADYAKITGGIVTLGQNATANIAEVDGSEGSVVFHYNYNKTGHVNGCINVTNAFVGPVSLRVDANFVNDAFAGTYPTATVFTVAKKAAATAPTAADFTILQTTQVKGHLPRLSVTVEEDTANDRWNVILHAGEIVRSVKDGPNGGNGFLAEYWSDEQATHNDADYYISHKWYTSSSAWDFAANMKSLTLNCSGGFWPNTSDLKFPDEFSVIGGEITTSGGTHRFYCATENGYMYIPVGAIAGFRPYGNSDVTFNFDMPFVGGGTIEIKNRGKANPGSGNVNFGSGIVNFNKPSPQFTGLIDMREYAEGLSYPYTLKESTKFGITEPLALGADLPEFTYNALRLSYYGTFHPLTNMTLPESSNRGIWVDWTGRVLIDEGMTVHINNRLTFSGTWEKLGAGTLFLGASVAPTFKATAVNNTAAKAMTETDKKGLVITEGALGVTSKTAVEGLAVKFKSGTTLAADANATGDQATYGLYNKTGTVSFEGDALKVRLTPPTEIVAEKTVALLTVPTAQAAAFEGKLVVEGLRGYTVSFSNEPAEGEDGMTTVTAKLMRRGAYFFLR